MGIDENPGIDEDQALDLLAVLINFEHRLGAAPGRTPEGIDLPGQSPAPEPPLVRRLARVEAQSGFNVLLTLLVQRHIVASLAAGGLKG